MVVCGFTRGCFECDEHATHTIPEIGSFDDERTGLPSTFATTDTCPKHAKAYDHHRGERLSVRSDGKR